MQTNLDLGRGGIDLWSDSSLSRPSGSLVFLPPYIIYSIRDAIALRDLRATTRGGRGGVRFMARWLFEYTIRIN